MRHESSNKMMKCTSSIFSHPVQAAKLFMFSNLILILASAANSFQTSFPPTDSNLSAHNQTVKMLKFIQVSACDGEQLDIRCNEDYNMDIITVAYTILPQTATTNTNGSISLSDNKVNNSNNNNNINYYQCPPLDRHYDSRQQQSPQLSLGTGNETNPVACDEAEASSSSSSPVANSIVQLVRNECHLYNSCSLDLRWSAAVIAQQQQRNKQTDQPNPGRPPAGSSQQLASQRLNKAELTRALHEKCPANRKLLEVAYRCRPIKYFRKVVCGGQRLELQCEGDRRLVPSTVFYGAQPNDTKTLERCQRELPVATTNETAVVANKATSGGGICLAQNASSTLLSHCLFKQSCQLDVTPSVLGQHHCPQEQATYLKLVYVCVNSSLLNPDIVAGFNQRQLALATQLAPTRQQQQTTDLETGSQRPTVAPSNVSSLLKSQVPSFVALPPATNNGPSISTSSEVNQSPVQATQPVDLQPDNISMAGTVELGPVSGRQQPQAEEENSKRYVSYPPAVDRQLRISAGKSPAPALGGGELAPNELLLYLLKTHLSEFMIAGALLVGVVLVSLLVRSCSRPASAARNKQQFRGHASDSAASSSASSASSSSAGSGGSSLALSQSTANGGRSLLQPGSANRNSRHPIGSCSESYFSSSLSSDVDYTSGHLGHPQQQANHHHHLLTEASHSANHSPSGLGGAGLDSIDEGGRPLRYGSSGASSSVTDGPAPHQSAARPKLWTIYGQQQPAQQQSGLQTAGTLRPTRTFLGGGGGQQQFGTVQAPRAPSLRCPASGAADLLLALAVNQHQQQQQWTGQRAATLAPGGGRHSLAERLALLVNEATTPIGATGASSLSSGGQPQPPPPLLQPPAAAGHAQQCAFHQQFAFQQPPPPTVQLELPQAPTLGTGADHNNNEQLRLNSPYCVSNGNSNNSDSGINR